MSCVFNSAGSRIQLIWTAVGLGIDGEQIAVRFADSVSDYVSRLRPVHEVEIALLRNPISIEEAQLLEDADEEPVVCTCEA